MTPEERAAKLEQLLGRENAPAPMHKLDMLEGLAKGEIESTTPPHVECKTEGSERSCYVEALRSARTPTAPRRRSIASCRPASTRSASS